MLRPSVLGATLAAAAIFATTSTSHADNAQALKDRLHAAAKDTSLTGDGVQPFHLKMSVQLYDAKGVPSEQGTIEISWADAHRVKVVETFPSYSATEIDTDSGIFRTETKQARPEMATVLVQQVLHPAPIDTEIDALTPQMQKVKLKELPLDCIMLAPSIGASPHIPMGLVPTYCLNPEDNAFRVTLRYGGQVVLRNSIAVFQQKHVAFDVDVALKGVQSAEGKIVTLEQRSFPDSDFSTNGLPLVPAGPVRVSAGVMAGLALSQTFPPYPPRAKARHIQGTVVLRAKIGKDGHIQDLQVISSPDPDLTTAAIDAVRQWKYRPYSLAGAPVDVETTINVNFTFGGR